MLSKSDLIKARFSEGDSVAFLYRRKTVEGTLLRLNPRRAVVKVGEESFTVPYNLLVPRSGNREKREQRLERTNWRLN
ncbi:hypothetical protein P4E94_06170 [Pontiellaceae bacterium B12219]|nr:hypothetical protein [Pontiellaceae bacterium B12219]